MSFVEFDYNWHGWCETEINYRSKQLAICILLPFHASSSSRPRSLYVLPSKLPSGLPVFLACVLVYSRCARYSSSLSPVVPVSRLFSLYSLLVRGPSFPLTDVRTRAPFFHLPVSGLTGPSLYLSRPSPPALFSSLISAQTTSRLTQNGKERASRREK